MRAGTAGTVCSLTAFSCSTLLGIAQSVSASTSNGLRTQASVQGAWSFASLLSKEQWPLPAALQLFLQHARQLSSTASQLSADPATQPAKQEAHQGRQQQQQQQQQQQGAATHVQLREPQLLQQQQQQQSLKNAAASIRLAAAAAAAAAGGFKQHNRVQDPRRFHGSRRQQQQQQQQQQVSHAPKQQRRRHQQQQQYAVRSGHPVSNLPAALQEAAAARKQGDTAAEQALLQKAAAETLAQLPAASVSTVQALLYAQSTQRFLLPQQQLQQLLQHLVDNMQECTLRHATAAVMAAQEAVRKAAAPAAAAAEGQGAVPAAVQWGPGQQQMLTQQYGALLKPLVDRSMQHMVEQQQQLQQQQQQQFPAPADSSSTAAAAAAAAAAVPPAKLAWLLKLHERIGQLPLPQQKMQQLLQHASATAAQFTLSDALRVLYHSNLSQLPLQSILHQPLLDQALALLLQELQQQQQPLAAAAAAASRLNHTKTVAAVLHAWENAGVAVPQTAMQQLVSHMAANAAECEPSHAIRAIRSAMFAGLQLQQQQQLQPLVARALLLKTSDIERTRAALLALLRAVSYMGAQLPQQQLEALVSKVLQLVPRGGMPVEEAAAALKAVSCMEMQLPRPLLKPLLRPLQREVRQGRQLQQLPQLLTAISRMGVDLPYATGLAPLLKAAKAALQTEALAAASAADEAAGSSSSSSRTRSRPHQQQEQQQQQQQQERLSASMIADLVRALQHMRDQLPAIYALPLTDVFLQQQPSPKDIAKYLCGFGAMSLAVNMPQLTIMLQQLLQPEALQQLSSAEVGKILWGVASMGYSLQPSVLDVLVRQQLAQPRQRVAYSCAQTLWAFANMGVSAGPEPKGYLQQQQGRQQQQQQQQQHQQQGQQQQQQQQQQGQQQGLAVQPELLQQLLQQLYTQLAADAARHHHQQQQQQQQGVGRNGDAPASAAGMYWQLSLAAWAVAVCDAGRCAPQVLQMCELLAAPHAWHMLRLSELVQLAWVHMWLCGYQWSDTGGLAAVLSQQQLADIREARQQQVRRVAASAVSGAVPRLARHQQQQQQQQRDESAADKMQLMVAAWGLGSDGDDEGESSNSSSKVKQQRQMLQQQEPRQMKQPRPPPQGVSVSQHELLEVLARLPCIASTRLEPVTADGMFSVDVEAVTVDGRLLAVEFDGPFHYMHQVEFELEFYDRSSRSRNYSSTAVADGAEGRDELAGAAAAAGEVPAGAAAVGVGVAAAAMRAAVEASAVAAALRDAPTPGIQLPAAFSSNNQDYCSLVLKPTALFRNKSLRARGYMVVCVPFYQWASKQPVVQQWLVQRLIDAALASEPPPHKQQ